MPSRPDFIATPALPAGRRPRIAYLITNSEIGGAQAHVGSLLQALGTRADSILLAGGDGPLFETARQYGTATVRLDRLDNALSPLRALAALRELVAALRRARPDLIHAHSAKAGALARVAGCLLRIPVVYTVHGFGFKAAAPTRQRLASRVVEWLLAPLTTRMICVAEAERELARTLPIADSRIRVIHNGIPDTPLRADPGAPLRRIAMVARFAAPKRPDLAIRAFAAAALQDCELVIAGEGPGLADARALADRLAPGRVRLPGNVSDIAGMLASAQLFVLASDHEGFPISVLEAMRAGLPVVASDLPGIREQLDDGRCGQLCTTHLSHEAQTGNAPIPGKAEAASDARPHEAVRALADALTHVAADAALRARLGEAARKRWEAHYSLNPMAEATWETCLLAMSTRITPAGPRWHG